MRLFWQPQVSVVLGFAQAPLERLLDTLDSVLAQQGVVLECVAVADGWPGTQALHARTPCAAATHACGWCCSPTAA